MVIRLAEVLVAGVGAGHHRARHAGGLGREQAVARVLDDEAAVGRHREAVGRGEEHVGRGLAASKSGPSASAVRLAWINRTSADEARASR